MKKFLALALAPAALALPSTASAVELITNGGFESGSFSGWTQGGNTGFTFVSDVNPHSGDYAAWLGPVNSTGTLSQTINTVVGQSYDFSYYLNNLGSIPNSFAAYIDGILVSGFGNQNGTPSPYTLFTTTFTATNALTQISFQFQHNPSYWNLDDVSVQAAVPEAATWAMMLVGFAFAGVAMRRRRNVRVSFA